jgi:hypothetical protein
MKLPFNHIFYSFIILSSQGMVFAQSTNFVEMPIMFSIPAIALVDFAGSDTRISFIQGNGAEQIITPSTLDKTWINYSSIVDGKSTNSISVNLSSGNLPAEIQIKLDVGQDVGAGAGTTGKPIRQIALTRYPQEIITGIGSCYTGRGTQKGHQLIYSWEWLPPYDFDHSSIDNIEISVTYTLTTAK